MLARCDLFILMPRRYYRRRTVTVRPKKKWASNMVLSSLLINSSNRVPVIELAVNSAQSGTPTPVILKTGNFKVNADFNALWTGNAFPQLVAAVFYVPEGIGIPDNATMVSFLKAHPEYILCWRQLDTLIANSSASNNLSFQQVTFSSRLKRNLNSGDRIAFGIMDTASSSNITELKVNIAVQFWSCAN